jgi:hypothetical protein
MLFNTMQMIHYLKNKSIDKAKWDDCISHSVNGNVYARSWYLDLVCPGWEALAEGDYDTVFPLIHRSKWGIKYLFQPYFTQQLGVFSRHHLTPGLVEEFLRSIPSKFRFIEINLNSFNKIETGKYKTVLRLNHEFDLINTYEKIISGYDQNTRRNLRKAYSEKITVRHKIDPDELISLFRENFGNKEGKLKFHHYQLIRNIMIYALKNTFSLILGAYMEDNTLCAGAFFLKEADRVILLFAGSDGRSRENGAMFLLIDTFIRDNAGQALILDFEGSNDPNVARFYKGFGARESFYYQVRINRLNPLTFHLVNFIKRLR